MINLLDKLREFDYDSFEYKINILYDFIVAGNGNVDALFREFKREIQKFEVLYRGLGLQDDILENLQEGISIDLGCSYSVLIDSAKEFSLPKLGHSDKKSVLIESSNMYGIYMPKIVSELHNELSFLIMSVEELNDDEKFDFETELVGIDRIQIWEDEIEEILSYSSEEEEVVVENPHINVLIMDYSELEKVWIISSSQSKLMEEVAI